MSYLPQFRFARRWKCVLLLPVLAAVGALVRAQSPAPPPANPPAQSPAEPAKPQAPPSNDNAEVSSRDTAPTFRVRVNLVLVRVVVRDQQGRVVPNLKKEDFLLTDNRKPQIISTFSVETPESHVVATVTGDSGDASADPAAAKAFIASHGPPIVVKADGLAAGKGVTVASDLDTAYRAVDAALVERRFSAAGLEIVVEDFLAGEEASFFALVDGSDALPLATAQDYKRVGDGDTGPNTGGMGAHSPSPILTPAIEGVVMERIILPAIAAMQREGRPFKGVLYAGLMLTEAGPMLLEFNARFGDPECQVLMMRLMSDPLPALIAAHDGVLKSVDLRWHADSALCVVMAANGYPGEPQRGSEIRGLDAAASDPQVKIFHAGTRREDTRLIADGGRVLGVTATGSDIATARDRAYAAVDRIQWPEGFCRRDIGRRALQD